MTIEGPFFQYGIRARQVEAAPEVERSALQERRDRELEDYLAGAFGNGTFEAPLRLGTYYLWVDGTGRLRIKSSRPTSATDGTVVGTQT